MSSRTGVVLLAAVSCFAAGCRTDGGIDRRDSVHGMKFAASQIAAHTVDDAKHTVEGVSRIPENVARSFKDGLHGMESTYYLYLETHEPSQR